MTAAGDDRRPVVRHLTQPELAERWRISPRTLERWRIAGIGPAWLRLNRRTLYRWDDILAFEAAHRNEPAHTGLEGGTASQLVS